jgi:hypothetical protein
VVGRELLMLRPYGEDHQGLWGDTWRKGKIYIDFRMWAVTPK